MLLTEITTISNNATDENFSTALVQGYFNEAIANINIAISAKLPYITTATASDDYVALDEEWIRSTVIPYVCYMIKTNDGSLNEASAAFFQRYQVNLSEMRRMKVRAVKPRYRFFWVEASELEFKNASYRLEFKTGTDEPSTAFLPNAWDTTPSTVAAVYTDDLQTVAFYKVEGGTGVKPMGVIGSNNVGWFGNKSTTTEKSGIIGD
jgi:hypothetical protein